MASLRHSGPQLWVRVLSCLPPREAVVLSVLSRTFWEAVRRLLRSVRCWRLRCRGGDFALIGLAGRCVGLTTVKLNSCGGITDAGVIGLAQHCAGLTTVDLTRCEIADAGVIGLAQHCAGLTYVEVSDGQVTEGAILQLGVAFPALEIYDYE